MQIIFGLDLGVASIGWAVIAQDLKNEELNEVLDAGVRIMPLNTDEIKEFGKGGNVPTNVARRTARGARRNLQRFRLRRHTLHHCLVDLGMMPDQRLLTQIPPKELFMLRDRALQEPLSLAEIGRVLLHLNLRRGYKSSRKDQTESDGKKQSDYLKEISGREAELDEKHQTIGQRFAAGLSDSANYRVRQQIFNRSTYIEEFDHIWKAQAVHHPEILTETNRRLLRDKIIYRQRPLRSQKGLVGECALEWNFALDAKNHEKIIQPNGLPKIVRPKCAPKSSPLAQECKVWESIHNLRVYDERGDEYILTDTHKRQIFDILQQEEKNLTATRLLKDILKLSPKTYTVDKLIQEKGLESNRTRAKLLAIFQKVGINRRDLLEFDPEVTEGDWDNPGTGERIHRLQLHGSFDQQPLYKLWHLIYATQEENDLARLLQERYQFTPEQAQALAEIDFTKEGYASKSHRAMRRLLPHYRKGLDYTKACEAAGYNHSNSLTKAENEGRTLLKKLDTLPKNSLRNPVVEKILNQMIHLVNELIVVHGHPVEIRVELARELKQGAKERQNTDKNNRRRENERKRIRGLIADDLGIQSESVTKVQIEKWKLYEETEGISLYTGQRLDRATFLRAEAVDVEHIIPKVRRFDDSFENKTICERKLNQDKNKSTARDFMESQPVTGLQSYEAYLRMIKNLADKEVGGISKAKYNRLMMTAEDVSNDTEFIARQLRETQYITKKARQLLLDVCHNVYTTSGSITDFLRHQWGWDEVIQDLRLPQFRELGLTEIKKIRRGEQDKEVIKDWDKRKDHRHHALDALAVACTRQSHVQRLNELNQTLEGKFGQDRRQSLLSNGRDKYIAGPAPFTHAQICSVIDGVLISFKQGNKVATRSRNKPKGSKKGEQVTITPRGSLHEETIYGRIHWYKKVPLNGRFDLALLKEMPHTVQRELVEKRLAESEKDPRKAFKDLDKKPIFYGKNNEKKLKEVTVWQYSLVSRKTVSPLLSEKSVSKIADPVVRQAIQARLDAGGGTSKEAFKNVGIDPIQVNQFPVRRVRVLNPAEKFVALPRGFVEPGSNHHIAIYRDAEGKKHEHVVTFWDAFLRVRLGIPAIISNVEAAYAFIEQAGDRIPDDIHLPGSPDWQFVTSLAINDMFVFDLDPNEVDFKDLKYKKMISKRLFRVRKLTSGAYWLLHHLETQILEDPISKKADRCKQCSISSLNGAVKVKIDRLGHIAQTEPQIN
jgi:CRISPR-associated endonuclease Csn1